MKPTLVPPPVPCSGPGCKTLISGPGYARETGGHLFCKRDCWEKYRDTQPPRYVVGQVRAA